MKNNKLTLIVGVALTLALASGCGAAVETKNSSRGEPNSDEVTSTYKT